MHPKRVGGLGTINLDVQNLCLLSKWLYKLINGDGVWQQLLKKKYLKNKILAQVMKRPSDSQFWSGFMEVKDHFFTRGEFEVQNEKIDEILGGLVDMEQFFEVEIP